jgi:hypothetical protein
MLSIQTQRLQRGDQVVLRNSYGSLQAGARGIVLEIHWVMQMCTVDFADETVAIVPYRLLDQDGECARAVGLPGRVESA